MKNIKNAIEAILFVSGDAVSLTDLASALEESVLTVSSNVDEMIDERVDSQAGIQIHRIDDKIQLGSNDSYEKYIKKLFMPENEYVITNAAIETLSIVAYKQPVTRGQIEQIRGVSCTYSLNALLNKDLIFEAGRKETIGHPILYATSDEFLRHFGISSIDELPSIDFAEVESQ